MENPGQFDFLAVMTIERINSIMQISLHGVGHRFRGMYPGLAELYNFSYL